MRLGWYDSAVRDVRRGQVLGVFKRTEEYIYFLPSSSILFDFDMCKRINSGIGKETHSGGTANMFPPPKGYESLPEQK